MPSFTDKSSRGTHRLHFRRRTAAEGFDMLIVRAAGLLIDLEVETEPNGMSVYTLQINQKGLKLIADLLKTHQIALIVDGKSEFEH